MTWKVLRHVVAKAVHVVQIVVWAPVLLMGFLIRGLSYAQRGWIRHFYYPVVILRRRVAGEDPWKEIDWMIGIGPPEGHPQYIPPEGLQGAGLVKPTVPMCHVCRATSGSVEVCEACRADRSCVAHGMTGCVPCDHCQIVPCGTCDGPTACCHPEGYTNPEHQCGICTHAKEAA